VRLLPLFVSPAAIPHNSVPAVRVDEAWQQVSIPGQLDGPLYVALGAIGDCNHINAPSVLPCVHRTDTCYVPDEGVPSG
jgi:hypothetical protein